MKNKEEEMSEEEKEKDKNGKKSNVKKKKTEEKDEDGGATSLPCQKINRLLGTALKGRPNRVGGKLMVHMEVHPRSCSERRSEKR